MKLYIITAFILTLSACGSGSDTAYTGSYVGSYYSANCVVPYLNITSDYNGEYTGFAGSYAINNFWQSDISQSQTNNVGDSALQKNNGSIIGKIRFSYGGTSTCTYNK